MKYIKITSLGAVALVWLLVWAALFVAEVHEPRVPSTTTTACGWGPPLAAIAWAAVTMALGYAWGRTDEMNEKDT
jgi:membrane protein DedA with SNARE-associated domain